MPTFDYAKSKATAERLIARFGQNITLRQKGANTGTASKPVYATTDTVVVGLDLRKHVRDDPGNLVTRKVRQLLVSTSAGVAPLKDDQVQLDGVWHTILDASPLNPAGTTLLYKLELEV